MPRACQHGDMPPIIGITAFVEQARWGPWDQRVVLLPHAYVEQVHAVGARAVVLPPGAEGAAELVDRLDGLILSGGGDIDPRLYGEAPHPETGGVREERDASELALLREALARDLPVLGICRGMELLVVASGGRLHQHLPDVVGHHGHRPAMAVVGMHDVRVEPGSRLAAVVGERLTVPSSHHQGVADPGALTPVAWAPDGTVEAVEAVDRPFVVGVLWHPEVAPDPRLFAAMTAAAAVTAG